MERSARAASISKQGDGLRISFEKRSGAELENRAIGVLVLRPLAGKWLIVEESDATTDARFKPKAGSCPEAALGILSVEPAIIADMARVGREYPEVTPGGWCPSERRRHGRAMSAGWPRRLR